MLSLILAFIGISIITKPKSISEMAYMIPTWIFSIWIMIVGLLLLPYIENNWLGISLMVGIAGVSATALYKKNYFHYIFGIICGIISLIIIITTNWYYLFGYLLVIPLVYKEKERWLFWLEIATYLILCITIKANI